MTGTSGQGAGPLVTVVALPTPWPVPGDYRRHAPDRDGLRRVLQGLAADRDWAALSWSGLIDGLLAAGRTDVPLSRLLEGHVDALRILAQAGAEPAPDALYGVWASRSQRTGVAATRTPDGLRLDGMIKFASGAEVVDHALVPVWLDDHTHLLLDLPVDGLSVDTSDWSTAAMEVSGSHTVPLATVFAEPVEVGSPNFYLDRAAFFPGGVGVAACWAGGAARIADLLLARLHSPVPPAMLLRIGRIRTQLVAAVSTLRMAAQRLDELGCGTTDQVDDADWHALSTEARAVVGEAVAVVLAEAHRLAGPAGLAFDEDLTRAVHDLQLYVLQQNEDGDAGFLGQLTVDGA